MKKLSGTAVLALVCVGLIVAFLPKASSTDASADTFKQLEQDFGDAIKGADIVNLNQILADDWASLGRSGISTKESFFTDLKSGKYKLESFEIGPLDVKMLDNVAVVIGSVTERTTTNGKDSSGKSVWMDVFTKRGDKWVLVRSHSAKVK